MDRGRYRRFTVIVVPSSEGNTLRFRLSLSTCQLLLSAAICVMLIAGVFISSHYALLADREELKFLRGVTSWQDEELLILEARQDALYGMLWGVLELDEHVREVAYWGVNGTALLPEASVFTTAAHDGPDRFLSPGAGEWSAGPARSIPIQEPSGSAPAGRPGTGDRGVPGLMPIPGGLIVDGYGYRLSTGGRYEFHRGVDIAAPAGTTVVAAAGGVVVFSGQVAGYGTVVRLDHGGGYQTLYGHLQESSVRRGDAVVRGGIVGSVAPAGPDSVPRVHYEVLIDGRPVDPVPYLAAR